ncbi:cation-translocating P-type ATPase [Maridesulfovibrio sp.]|uniref:heavy metal translocating P-type ATPase n=1 Tax=Maridesulfovibrio sp. TaxID=2795000 RepID=UPI002A188CF2|nr:cation-translocating P-type ATPase [Maridesulfovibrio sp.]
MNQNISIRHSIPGRVRFRIRSMSNNPSLAEKLDNELKKISHIEYIRPNIHCGSLTIRFNPELEDLTALVSCIQELAGNGKPSGAGTLSPCASSMCECKACRTTNAGCNPVKSSLVRFLAVSSVMGVVFVRTTVMGLAVAETALSPLGLIAIGLSLPLFKKAYHQLKQKRFTLEAFLGASCVAAVAAGEALTAFEVLWINSGAELVKSWITERSRKSISSILEVTSHHTFVLADGVEVEKEVRDLRKGDTVVLHTGEKVCVDGEIVDGEALLDESPISGRSDLIHRKSGDKVLAGTFVRQGVIYVKAREVGDRTYLSRILKMVEDSLENRAPIEGVADRLAANLIRLGFVTTAGTWLLTGSLYRAFTVLLVMACPCATVLAASTAVSAAISAAAKRNILIKGGRYLEEAGRTEIICFDKTGTLTTNEPILSDIVPLNGTEQKILLQTAVSVEMHNHHPLAQTIKHEADKQGIEPKAHTVCEYLPGMGMRAEISGSEILVGNGKLMDRYEVDTSAAAAEAAPLHSRGRTVLFVADSKRVTGLLAFDNMIRPESREAVSRLRTGGAKDIILITGDERNTAMELAGKLGITEVHASVMPEDKAGIVAELQTQGAAVLMIGDGVNDALALARADVGVAMGAGGSEVAIEAADIALVNDDLGGLVYVQSLSRETLRVVHQNFWIASGSNLAGVVLGAMGLLSPVMAGLIHIGHSLGVLANSARLLRYDPPALETSNTLPEQ